MRSTTLRFALAAVLVIAALTAVELALDSEVTFSVPKISANSLGSTASVLAYPLIALPLLYLSR